MNIKSLVRGRENEIIEYVTEFYDVELHGDEHWFAYDIKGEEIDIKVVYEDDELAISAYSLDYNYTDEFVKIV
jgi:hypothetical protein